MAYAKNGAAIINGMVVPKLEVSVLHTLVHIGKPATVPQIALTMNEVVSDSSLYTLLRRLQEKRGLVTRKETLQEGLGRPVKRVEWLAHQAATDFFKEEPYHEHPCHSLSPVETPG